MDHVTVVTPLSGTVDRPKANNWYSLHCKHTKFDDTSFGRSKDNLGGVKFKNWSRNPDHAHLGDSWSPEG